MSTPYQGIVRLEFDMDFDSEQAESFLNICAETMAKSMRNSPFDVTNVSITSAHVQAIEGSLKDSSIGG